MKKSIIFLDHDGVMCVSSQFGTRFKKQKKWNKLNPDKPVIYTNDFDIMDVEYRFDNFDKKAVKILNEIIEKTDCEIVVSSDWRFHCSLKEMGDLYEIYGVIKKPIDYTSMLDIEDFKHLELVKGGIEEERAYEIKKWLSLNKTDKWVAVDDLDMNMLNNFVHTKRISEGIKQSGIQERILEYLI
jgi:hypothetical protein